MYEKYSSLDSYLITNSFIRSFTRSSAMSFTRSFTGLFPVLDEVQYLNENEIVKYTNKIFNSIYKSLCKNDIPDIRYMIKYSSLNDIRLIEYYVQNKTPKYIEYLTMALETDNAIWIKYLLKIFGKNRLQKIVEQYLLNTDIKTISLLFKYRKIFTVNKKLFHQLPDESCVFAIQNNLYKFDKVNNGLYYACKYDLLKLAKLMIEYGADDFDKGLYEAYYHGNKELEKLMIEYGAFYNVLKYAFERSNHIKLAKYMLKNGFNKYMLKNGFSRGLIDAC